LKAKGEAAESRPIQPGDKRGDLRDDTNIVPTPYLDAKIKERGSEIQQKNPNDDGKSNKNNDENKDEYKDKGKTVTRRKIRTNLKKKTMPRMDIRRRTLILLKRLQPSPIMCAPLI
jgi:hypothetical protein